MKDQRGIIVLLVICLGLGGALIWNQQRISAEKAADDQSIGGYSNKLVEISALLDQKRQANASLEDNLQRQHQSFIQLTNAFTGISRNLERAETALHDTREEMTNQISGRDFRIAELETQNQLLDRRAVDLGNGITNLTGQIADTQRQLAAAEGDRTFLEKELQWLVAAKAELEREFDDLAALQQQVAKVKDEVDIARRLQWTREGLFVRQEQKGGEQLMQKASPASQPKPPNYDLSVEINADGVVKIIPPLPENPAPAAPAPAE